MENKNISNITSILCKKQKNFWEQGGGGGKMDIILEKQGLHIIVEFVN